MYIGSERKRTTRVAIWVDLKAYNMNTICTLLKREFFSYHAYLDVPIRRYSGSGIFSSCTILVVNVELDLADEDSRCNKVQKAALKCSLLMQIMLRGPK